MITGGGPWIGMPAQLDLDQNRQVSDRRYADAVAAAGGVPLILPLLGSALCFHYLAERLDGILLTGSSSDVDPALYGAVRSRLCGPIHVQRDEMDFFLLQTALRRRIPVLAVCYGMQSLNVYLGGSLIQDIATCIGSSVRHNSKDSNGLACHKIEISAGSFLEAIAGGREICVNSTHHQALDRIGCGLKVIARSCDRIVESVMHSDPDQWIVGVQWHPEKDFDRNRFSQKLFEYFIARCRAVRGSDEGTDT